LAAGREVDDGERGAVPLQSSRTGGSSVLLGSPVPVRGGSACVPSGAFGGEFTWTWISDVAVEVLWRLFLPFYGLD